MLSATASRSWVSANEIRVAARRLVSVFTARFTSLTGSLCLLARLDFVDTAG
ncbi:MAG: hypothetical protein AAF989_04210 [Planctomycetota bacterium]